MSVTEAGALAGALESLTEHRNDLVLKVQSSRSELVDLLATDAHEDDILGEAVRLVRVRARVAVADTAITYVRSGDDPQALGGYLKAAHLSGLLPPEMDVTVPPRRRGALQEIEVIEGLIARYID